MTNPIGVKTLSNPNTHEEAVILSGMDFKCGMQDRTI